MFWYLFSLTTLGRTGERVGTFASQSFGIQDIGNWWFITQEAVDRRLKWKRIPGRGVVSNLLGTMDVHIIIRASKWLCGRRLASASRCQHLRGCEVHTNSLRADFHTPYATVSSANDMRCSPIFFSISMYEKKAHFFSP